MTGREALSYLSNPAWRSSRLGLERMRELLTRLGHPEAALKIVHIAGTNGKGSVSMMLAAMLEAGGYKVGLYTSPALNAFHERIRVRGACITDQALGEAVGELAPAADAMADHPSEFELTTAAALLHFAREGVDIAVLETGMGGRLDATNAIPPPALCVITPIALDHTRELGASAPEIAREKAGIIKPGTAVVLAPQCPAAAAVIEGACAANGSMLIEVDRSRLCPLSWSLSGQSFAFQGYGALTLPLLGEHQLTNAATALTAMEALAARGFPVPPEAVRRGLARAYWPGRFEVLSRQPTVIIDGAHNPHGALALSSALDAYCPNRRATLVLGILADKDVDGIIAHLAPVTARAIATTPNSPRALPAPELLKRLARAGFAATAQASVARAITDALDDPGPDGLVVIAGSLYLVDAARRAVEGALIRITKEGSGR